MAGSQTADLPEPYKTQDLERLGPTIRMLMDIAGTGGLVVGVQREGEKPWYWCSDMDPNQPGKHQQKCTKDTVFPIFSLTKLFTSMAVAKWLASTSAQENGITWDTDLEDVEPKVSFRDPNLRRRVKIVDLLSHNTGMTKSGCYRGGSTGMLAAAYRPENTGFYYNNLGYKHAGQILEKNNSWRKDRADWGAVIQGEFLKPWGMSHTTTGHPGWNGTDDVADGYHALDTGKAVQLAQTSAGGTSFAKASGGMYSCAADLLKAYVKVKRAIQGRDDAPEEIKHVAKKLFSPRTVIEDGYGDYCLGLVKVNLPGRMGYLGLNRDLMLPERMMPEIGSSKRPVSVYYHQGSGTRGLAAMAIVPDMNVVVVVLSDTLALNDCADWVLQLVLSKMMGGPSPENFIGYAALTRENNIHKYLSVRNKLARGSGQPHSFKNLESCSGIYRNAGGYLDIEVDVEKCKLFWTKQYCEDERFRLYHHGGNTYHWLGPRKKMAAGGIWIPKEEHWLVTFHVGEDGEVKGLTWLHDPHNKQSGEFLRVNDSGESTSATGDSFGDWQLV